MRSMDTATSRLNERSANVKRKRPMSALTRAILYTRVDETWHLNPDDYLLCRF